MLTPNAPLQLVWLIELPSVRVVRDVLILGGAIELSSAAEGDVPERSIGRQPNVLM
jgi:hypothetical protein